MANLDDLFLNDTLTLRSRFNGSTRVYILQ